MDITAPGVNILSTDLNGSYKTHDGTSSATPIVAGLAGLLMAHGVANPLNMISQTADAMPLSTAYSNGRL